MEAEFQSYFTSSCGTVLHSAITYVIPIFELAAIVINLFNAAVFSKWKNPFYRNLSVNSSVDAILFILYFGFTQTICKSGHSFVFTFEFQLAQILTLYSTRVIGLTSALINIQIGFDRFKLVTKRHIQKNSKMRLILFFLISFGFYTPMYFIVHIYQIEKCTNCTINDTNNSTGQYFYFTYFSEFIQKHDEIKHFAALVHYTLSFAYLAVMIVLNVLIYKKYISSKSITNDALRVRYLNNEDNLEFEDPNENQSGSNVYEENRVTLMVFWISCVIIVEHFLSMAVPTIAFVAYGNKFRIYLRSLAVIVLFRSISSFMKTLFYYIFYLEYNKMLKKNYRLLAFVIFFSTSLFTFCLFFRIFLVG